MSTEDLQTKFGIFCTLTATLLSLSTITWEVLKVVPWTFHLKQLMRFDLDHVLTIKNLNFMILPCIEIWFCMSGYLSTVYMIHVREWENHCNSG